MIRTRPTPTLVDGQPMVAARIISNATCRLGVGRMTAQSVAVIRFITRIRPTPTLVDGQPVVEV